jgi:hypothetical protein
MKTETQLENDGHHKQDVVAAPLDPPVRREAGSAPPSPDSQTHIAIFCILGAGLGALISLEFSPEIGWLGIPAGAIIGYAINWAKADRAADKFE